MSTVAPFTAPFDEHGTLPLSTALSSSSVWSDDFSYGWIGAELARRRARRLTTRPALRLLFACQLALHTSLAAASVAMLAHHSDIRQLWTADSEPSAAFRLLEALPAWLLARSVVSVALSARRLWLAEKWQSTVWEAAWCVLVVWLSTVVMAASSFWALNSLPSSQSPLYVILWAVVPVLLLLLGAHIGSLSALALFFPVPALTVSTPMVPLAQHWYDRESDGSRSKPERHQGLTPQQLQAMPTSVCAARRDDNCCAVCMDDVEVGQVERVLKCGHAYHQPCIDQWLLKKRVCPLCVRAVSVSSRSVSISECVVELADMAEPADDELTEPEQSVV